MKELPFETYERLMGKDWPGGSASPVLVLLWEFGIEYKPGSAEANLALQRELRKLACPMCGCLPRRFN